MHKSITMSADDLKKKLESTEVSRLEKRFEFKGKKRRRECDEPMDAGGGFTVQQCE